MFEYIFVILSVWILLKVSGLMFRTIGHIAGFLVGSTFFLLLGILAVTILGLAFFVLPAILIFGICGLIAQSGE